MGAIRPGSAGSAPAAGSIDATALASNAVTKAKVADAAIGSAEIDSSEAAAIRTAIGAPADATVTVDDMTGTGWSVAQSAPNSTASWASSKLTVSIAASYVASHPGAERTYTTEDNYDVLARYDFVTGNGQTLGCANMWCGVDANNGTLCQVYGDGQVNAGYLVGGSWTEAQARTAGPSSGQRTGGELWLRTSRRGSMVLWYWGEGTSGAVPTSWTLIGAAALSSAAARATRGGYVHVGANSEGGFTGPLSIDVLAIRRSVQPAVTL